MNKIIEIGRWGAIPLLVLAFTPGLAMAQGEPTCSDTLSIANHGQHIVGDYVTDDGHVALGWPPAGKVGGSPAFLPGGPGPAGHFPGVKPGASFCVDQAQSDKHVPGPHDDPG